MVKWMVCKGVEGRGMEQSVAIRNQCLSILFISLIS
jgi:hypothetical protein